MKTLKTNQIEKGQTLFVVDTQTNLKGYIQQFVNILAIEDQFGVIKFAKSLTSLEPSATTIKISEWTFAETSEEFQAAALGQDYWANVIQIKD